MTSVRDSEQASIMLNSCVNAERAERLMQRRHDLNAVDYGLGQRAIFVDENFRQEKASRSSQVV